MTSALLASIHRVHEGVPHRVKDEEKALLFREICADRTTRKGLARRLGIRPSGVGAAVQELIDHGLVAETQPIKKEKSGRPRAILSPRPGRFVAISLYVDSRAVKGVLVDLGEEVIAEEMRVIPPGAGNRELAAAIRALLDSLPSRVPAGSELVGAGLSLVGTVNAHSRTWVGVARWPKLRNLDVSAIESRLGFPLILQRTNDVELAYALDAGRDSRTITAVLLHWGFGIGSAVSFRGTLLTSSLGRFGEIGHARLDAGSRAPCLCGALGCLETRAALWALLPALRKRLGSLPENEKELASILGESRIMDLREVTLALDAVGQALHVLYLVFYPDSILLSGPLMENPSIFCRVEESFLRSLPSYARGAVKLSVIPGGMPGCRRGGAHPLFRNALARTLRRNS